MSKLAHSNDETMAEIDANAVNQPAYNDEPGEIEEAPDDTTPTDLGKITLLAREAVNMRKLIAESEAQLKNRQAALRTIEEVELPRAMIDIGMTNFSLVGGGNVELKTEHYGSITKAKQAEAFKLLEDSGHGALIKRTLSAAFGKGDGALADKLKALIAADFKKAKFGDKQGVHAGTLGAFIREQIAAGTLLEDTPMWAALGVYTRRYAAIELPDSDMGHNNGPALDDEEDF
jgi:hypothetical protein